MDEYLRDYLFEKRYLPAELAEDFIHFVYSKHGTYSTKLLMEEVRKAMRIHMYLNRQVTERRTDKEINRLV